LFGGFGNSRGDRDNSSGGNAGALIAIAVFVLAADRTDLFPTARNGDLASTRVPVGRGVRRVHAQPNARCCARSSDLAQTESPLKNASRGTAHLFIVNPLEGAGNDGEGFFANLLSTHPPLAKRIARLRALAGESGPDAAQQARHSPDAAARSRHRTPARSSGLIRRAPRHRSTSPNGYGSTFTFSFIMPWPRPQ
jgi:hypothetical protein